MKKFLISLGLVCALVFGAFADEVADADIEAQNDAIAAEQEAAQNEEAVAEAEPAEDTVAEEPAAEETEVAEGETPEEAVAEETAEPAEEAVAEETAEPAEEAVAEETAEPAEEAVAEETAEPAEEAVAEAETEDAESEESDAITADIAAAAEEVADAAVSAGVGVAEEELNALIASFPQGVWIDEKYNAAWVFDENGTLTVQNAKSGDIYFTFSLNKINSYSVVPTADGIAVSFVCGETKRQYTFTKSNADDYNMTLQIQAKWLKSGYTTTMTKKQDLAIGE